jgi:hypothetical protein
MFANAHLNQTNGIVKTPKGLTFVDQWGSLRHAAGVAGVLAGYARVLRTKNRAVEASPIMALAERQVRPAVMSLNQNYHKIQAVVFSYNGCINCLVEFQFPEVACIAS